MPKLELRLSRTEILGFRRGRNRRWTSPCMEARLDLPEPELVPSNVDSLLRAQLDAILGKVDSES